MPYRLVLAAVLILFNSAASLARGNQLETETSPYLQLHATDPVHWRSWNDAALAEAKATKKPILLSIGYLACHWCHVMQDESYTNPTIAAAINRDFVAILIDREQRPDLDHTFQHAALVMDLPTGWPLTLFLTPDGQPFWGGTYFPDTPRGGMAGFGEILVAVATGYREDPDGIGKDAARIAKTVAQLSAPRAGTITAETINAIGQELLAQIDPLSGGFGDAAKFPQTPALALLWRAYVRTGADAYRDAVVSTLYHMLDGGLFDHVGGGFFRYTVDPLWHTPHFEKMLDTNAALLQLMADVWRETRDPLLKQRAEQTVAFMKQELQLADGAFATSLDAVSSGPTGENEEGAFYVWDKAALQTLLGDQALVFFDVFALAPVQGSDVLDRGLPYRHTPGERLSLQDRALKGVLQTLRAKRNERPRPRRDEKVLADWNGMVVRALVNAGTAFDRPDWISMARRAFDSVSEQLSVDDQLHQAAHGGRTAGPATATGLGNMINAAISLFEVSGEEALLENAVQWANDAIGDYWDATSMGFFESAAASGPLPVRGKIITDTPNVSGNAVLMEAFARLYYLTGGLTWREHALKTQEAFAGHMAVVHPAVAGFTNASETMQRALQIVVIGERTHSETKALLSPVYAMALGARTLHIVRPGETLPDGHPAQYKTQIDGHATAYVCQGAVCSLPAASPGALKQTLETMRRAR